MDKAGREATTCGIQAGTTVEREPGEEGPREQDGAGGVSRASGWGEGTCSGLPAGTTGLINDWWRAHGSPKWIPAPHVDPRMGPCPALGSSSPPM